MIETARGEEDRVRLTVRRSIQINRSQRNCRGVKNLMETSASCSTHIHAKAPSHSLPISGLKRAHNVLMAKKRKGRKHIKVSTKLNFWKFATRYTRINEENCFSPKRGTSRWTRIFPSLTWETLQRRWERFQLVILILEKLPLLLEQEIIVEFSTTWWISCEDVIAYPVSISDYTC